MSRNSAVASSPPVIGTTRDTDLVLDMQNGTKEIGSAPQVVRNLRTSGDQNNIGISLSSVVSTMRNGRFVWDCPSGLGYGVMAQYGIVVATQKLLPGAYGLRRGCMRFVCTMSASSGENPNNDVGMQIVIGGGALAQLYANDNVEGAGTSGFGIWMLNGHWNWGIKSPLTAQHVLDEIVPLVPGFVLPVGNPFQFELRVFDAGEGDPGPEVNARCEVLVSNAPVLTRYWENPPDVTTPLLPAFSDDHTVGSGGAALYAQVRNTSTGPAHVYFDYNLIHGPVDEGTI